jgi:uncharacterized membrane protein
MNSTFSHSSPATPRHLATLTLIAMMAALTFLATLVRIAPNASSYFNLSEAVVYTGALLFGGAIGGLAGGIGASLADILAGFALPWAPITFVIKGLEGLLVGSLGRLSWRNRLLGDLLSTLAAFPIMIGCYTLAAGLIYGWPAAIVELVTDLFQCTTGLLIAIPLVYALRKTRLFESRWS